MGGPQSRSGRVRKISPPTGIRSRWVAGMQEHMLLHTRQSAIQNNKYQSWSCSKALYKPVWHMPLLSVQWINSWWWTEELSETCRVSCQNKFVKLVHLVGFITNMPYFVSKSNSPKTVSHMDRRQSNGKVVPVQVTKVHRGKEVEPCSSMYS